MTGIQLTGKMKPPTTLVKQDKTTDWYDPMTDSIYLTGATWNGKSAESLACAAHECGHAIQKHRKTLAWRCWSLLPATKPLWWLAIAVGAMEWLSDNRQTSAVFGCIAVFLSLLRYFVVLWLEHEASEIALAAMPDMGGQIDILRARTVLRGKLKTYAVR